MPKLLLLTLLAILASSSCAESGYLAGIGTARHRKRVLHEHRNSRRPRGVTVGQEARHAHGLVLRGLHAETEVSRQREQHKVIIRCVCSWHRRSFRKG